MSSEWCNYTMYMRKVKALVSTRIHCEVARWHTRKQENNRGTSGFKRANWDQPDRAAADAAVELST